MADTIETRKILTKTAFENFDTKFRDTVFDSKNPYGYITSNGERVPASENETDLNRDVKTPSSGYSFIFATTADINSLFS